MLSRATKMLSTILYRDWMSMDSIGGTAILMRSGNIFALPSGLEEGVFPMVAEDFIGIFLSVFKEIERGYISLCFESENKENI